MPTRHGPLFDPVKVCNSRPEKLLMLVRRERTLPGAFPCLVVVRFAGTTSSVWAHRLLRRVFTRWLYIRRTQGHANVITEYGYLDINATGNFMTAKYGR